MKHPHLLHIFSPTKYVSPFDINMAYEANFSGVIPYCGVELDEVHGLTQDTIFSRSTEGVKRTGIFIGGRDFELSLRMLEAARAAMVPPFAVSVMADPSGAITTAAAMVALVEQQLEQTFSMTLRGTRSCILGGTGPVGECVGLLMARAGAECVIVSRRGLEAGQQTADKLRRKFDVELNGADGSSDDAIRSWLGDIDVVFNTAKAGARVVDAQLLKHAKSLKVIADGNAVPPSGVEGVAADDRGATLSITNGRTARTLGALAIGDVKFRVHTELLEHMHGSSEPVYIAFEEAFKAAREIVSRSA
jgi:methylene-tetrahydromethanopterin dehydrogenase